MKASSARAMTSTIALPMPTTSIGATSIAAAFIETGLQAGRRKAAEGGGRRRKAAEYREIAQPHKRRRLFGPLFCNFRRRHEANRLEILTFVPEKRSRETAAEQRRNS